MSSPMKKPEHHTARAAFEACQKIFADAGIIDPAAIVRAMRDVEALNTAVFALHGKGVDRQIIARFVQTWATVADAADDEEAQGRS
jgi:hypothetical protein